MEPVDQAGGEAHEAVGRRGTRRNQPLGASSPGPVQPHGPFKLGREGFPNGTWNASPAVCGTDRKAQAARRDT